MDPTVIAKYIYSVKNPIWSTINKNNLTVKIGHGTFGEVYRGNRKTDNKTAAIKRFVQDEELVLKSGVSMRFKESQIMDFAVPNHADARSPPDQADGAVGLRRGTH
ncbi:hypothetical protein L596_015322 [Steinernema carpocapsae]|uniref:Protein kinase domain-containing protein n=1 Tax=Steinernema carpocapsae TaxID=34508 RepID=A0A4U5NFI7_STECR|nr:hypothetical protein L596_015322 [Steinernema carpocapsae]